MNTIDSISRLIGAADFQTFRQTALLYLSLRGYAEVELADGPNDGGMDFRVFAAPTGAAKFCVQVSTQLEWKSKLHDDAIKAQQILHLDNMLYITSRRIPEAEFTPIAEGLWRDHQITVRRIDGQGLATAFVQAQRVPELLDALGFSQEALTSGRAVRPSLRDETAFAVALFGVDAGDFRSRVIERAVVAALGYNPNRDRQSLESLVGDTLALDAGRVVLISRAIDELLRSRRIRKTGNAFELAEEVEAEWRAARARRLSSYGDLYGQVLSVLTKEIPSVESASVRTVVEYLGSVLMSNGHHLSQELRPADDATGLLAAMRARIRDLDVVLESNGLLDEPRRRRVVTSLLEIAGSADFGHYLAAGELFLSLMNTGTPHLIRALGVHETVELVLDTNIAIPMLSSLLHTLPGHRQRFFVGAAKLHAQAQHHGLHILVPSYYVEEMAAHLIKARDDYGEVADIDPDLRISQNGFVAHYVALRMAESDISFREYISSFGLTDTMRTDPEHWRITRDQVMNRLNDHLARYGIKVRPLPRMDASLIRTVEEEIQFTLRDRLQDDRPRILMEHDVQTYCYTQQRVGVDTTRVLVSWDRLFHHLTRQSPDGATVLDPETLLDLLAYTAPRSDSSATATSPLALALEMEDEAAKLGAEVWDRIVQVQRGDWRDGQLIEQALAFKKDFLARVAAQQLEARNPADVVADEWANWKSRIQTHQAGEAGQT